MSTRGSPKFYVHILFRLVATSTSLWRQLSVRQYFRYSYTFAVLWSALQHAVAAASAESSSTKRCKAPFGIELRSRYWVHSSAWTIKTTNWSIWAFAGNWAESCCVTTDVDPRRKSDPVPRTSTRKLIPLWKRDLKSHQVSLTLLWIGNNCGHGCSLAPCRVRRCVDLLFDEFFHFLQAASDSGLSWHGICYDNIARYNCPRGRA